MHFITLVALVTLVAFPRELLRIPLGASLGPPRKAMRAVEGYNGRKSKANTSQIQPKSSQSQPKTKPDPKPNPDRVKIPIEIPGKS